MTKDIKIFEGKVPSMDTFSRVHDDEYHDWELRQHIDHLHEDDPCRIHDDGHPDWELRQHIDYLHEDDPCRIHDDGHPDWDQYHSTTTFPIDVNDTFSRVHVDKYHDDEYHYWELGQDIDYLHEDDPCWLHE